MLGKVICDIKPNLENRRNSEGSLIALKNGDILFAYSRFGGMGCQDDNDADIYGVLSKDSGETFGEPFPIIIRTQFQVDSLTSPSCMRMQNGDLGMFFCAKIRKTGPSDCQSIYYLIRSADEGKTWSNPVLCTENEGYFVVNNDRVMRCTDGRILMPAAKFRYIKDYEVSEGYLNIFESKDDGYTWETIAKDITIPLSSGCTTGVQEPGLLQLDEHTLWCYIRTDAGRQYECFSEDGGYSWTDPLPSRFTSPLSPMSAKRLSDGRIIAVWNPIPLYNGRGVIFDGVWTAGRNPLVIAVSEDNGKTFKPHQYIETREDHGYCYTAILETTDKAVLLAYNAGGKEEGSANNSTRIRKIGLDEL